MQTQIKKWGNSLALRIPKALAEQIDLVSDHPVELTVVDGRLIVEPLSQPQESLALLLAKITPENVHDEIETGTAVGSEVW